MSKQNSYLLVQTLPGRVAQVAEEVRALPDVHDAIVVHGPYDLIVQMDSRSMSTVIEAAAGIEGILHAVPCAKEFVKVSTG